MFYKKRFIRNTSLIPEINKKRGLVLLEKLRNGSIGSSLERWRNNLLAPFFPQNDPFFPEMDESDF